MVWPDEVGRPDPGWAEGFSLRWDSRNWVTEVVRSKACGRCC